VGSPAIAQDPFRSRTRRRRLGGVACQDLSSGQGVEDDARGRDRFPRPSREGGAGVNGASQAAESALQDHPPDHTIGVRCGSATGLEIAERSPHRGHHRDRRAGPQLSSPARPRDRISPIDAFRFGGGHASEATPARGSKKVTTANIYTGVLGSLKADAAERMRRPLMGTTKARQLTHRTGGCALGRTPPECAERSGPSGRAGPPGALRARPSPRLDACRCGEPSPPPAR
jgi:hypothetical protein